MSEIDFWDRVKRGADKLGISDGTVNVWKHRGRVSSQKIVPLYQALQGTEYEISLDQLQKNH